MRSPRDFAVAAGVARRLVADLVERDLLHAPLLLNVNVPHVEDGEPRGIKPASMSLVLGEQRYERRVSPRGAVYYWDDWSAPEDDVSAGSDLYWFVRGWVTVAPLRIDQTDLDALELLRERLER